MEYKDILFEQLGEIGIVTLNRPQSLNALTPLMVHELKQVFYQLSKDSSIKVVILKGSGRAFSAGVDLNAMNESLIGGQFTQNQIILDGNELALIIRKMPQVAMVEIHGHCYTRCPQKL